MKKLRFCLKKLISIYLLLLASMLFLVSFQPYDNQEIQTKTFYRSTDVLGVWWWWVNPREIDSHLNFAAEKGINEIYYYTIRFDRNTGAFVERAYNRGIKVFLLLDDYNYIFDRPSFIRLIVKFMEYQRNAPENRKFTGLHFDLEPHQHPEFDNNAAAFLQRYMNFVYWVCNTYRTILERSTPGIIIDFDITEWYRMNISYKEDLIPLYRALILEADRVFIMAYRDSAQSTFESAKQELDFARSLNKQIILGVETGRWDEDPSISYYEKGVDYFYEQLELLPNLVNYNNLGLSIHHMTSWFSMH